MKQLRGLFDRAWSTHETKKGNLNGVKAEMPRYLCHKQVWALKIADIKDPTEPGNESDGSRIIVPADAGFAPFRVECAYVHKHKPEVGGYYVVYADGYKSYSPAKAFEDGYTRVP
jgi:hypothetical protein